MRAIAGLLAALLSTQCLQDFAGPPGPPAYDVVLDDFDTVYVGDTLGLPSARLLVSGKEVASGWKGSILEGEDVIRLDSTLGIIVLKRGSARIRIEPVNTVVTDSSAREDVDIVAAVPRIILTGPDTAYSVGDELTLTATALTRDSVPIEAVPLTWTPVGADTAFAVGSSANIRRALKNGQLTLRVQVDTATATKTVHVVQRLSALTVSPRGTSVNTPTTLSVIANDARGNVMATPTIAWSSMNPAVATVHPASGLVTPVSSGQSTIVATASGVTADAVVTVGLSVATPVNLWIPMNSGVTGNLGGIWGTSLSNIFAVGADGAIRRFDGTDWNTSASNTTLRLIGVWGLSESHVLAVGVNGVMRQFDGSTWQTVASNVTTNLVGIWGSGTRPMFVSGDPGILMNGPTGYQISLPGGSPAGGPRGIWGLSAVDVYAVQDGVGLPPMFRWNGTQWNSVTLPVMDQGLFGVWGSSTANVVAVGRGSAAFHFDGGQWTTKNFASSGTMRSVWGSGPADVYAVGESGRIERFDGNTWTAVTSGTTNLLAGVWGFGNSVFVVGDGGMILRGYRGATMSVSPANVTRTEFGLTQQYTRSAQDALGAALSPAVTWTSSNPAVATINSSGLATTVGDGTTNICAIAAGGVQGCTTLTVNQDKVVASVVITPGGATVGANGSPFGAIARNAFGATIAGKTFTWASQNTAVATINSSTGAVTGVSTGQTAISATSDGVTGYAVLTVAGLAEPAAVNLWAPLSPIGNPPVALNAVWGPSPTSAFVVGDGGVIAQYNGSSWSGMASGVSTPLAAVWGTSATNVFAVGAGGVILHYNGSSWSSQTSPTTKNLYAIWGSAPNDVWAAGEQNTLLQFNGTSWALVQTLSSGSTGLRALWGHARTGPWARGIGAHLLFDGSAWNPAVIGSGNSLATDIRDMWGTATDNVFAVGASGAIQRFNGTDWSTSATIGAVAFNGVWGTTGSDVYAVGAAGAMARFDGANWSVVTTGVSAVLNGVWGTSQSDMFAVGSAGTILRGVRGATVTVTPSGPNVAPSRTRQLSAVARDAAANAVASVTFSWHSSDVTKATVDANGLVTAVAAGATNVCATAPGGVQGCTTVTVSNNFAVASIAVTPGGGNVLAGGTVPLAATVTNVGGVVTTDYTVTWSSLNANVATVDPSTGVVTGVAAGQAVIAASADGVTGYALVTVSAPTATAVTIWASEDTPSAVIMHDVWGASATNLFVVDEAGRVWRNTGGAWASTTVTNQEQLLAIWGTSPTDVFAVGTGGAIFRFDGNGWGSQTSGVTSQLNAVWGSSPRNVFAVGAGGVILRYNGSTWAPMNSTVTTALNYVWGTSSSNVFAVGNGGVILRYDGSAWAALNSTTTNDLNGVWGLSASDVFAVGASGTVLRYNGSNWSQMTSNTGAYLTGVWGSSANEVFAVGSDGPNSALIKFNGTGWSGSAFGVAAPINRIWGTSVNGSAFAVGQGGALMHGHRGATVAVSPATPSIGALGATQQMSASALTQAAATIANVSFTWSSSDEAVATVNASGLVTAVANGTTSVCATATGGGAQGCTTVTVAQLAAVITVSPTGGVSTGADVQFLASAVDANNNPIPGKTFTWTSLNPAIGTMTSGGLLDVLAGGQVTVAASADGAIGYGFATIGVSSTSLVNLWAPMDSLPTVLRGIWGLSSSNVYAVGDGGVMRHFDGTTWGDVVSGTTEDLNGIWGSSATDIFAVGGSGTILHFDGAEWTPMQSGITEDLSAVWGTSPRNVFAAGAGGKILRYDGATWTEMTSGTTESLTALWGSSPSDVFVTGLNGTIRRYDGNVGFTWAAQTSNAGTESVRSISGTAGTAVVAVGSGNYVRRYNGATWAATTGVAAGTYNGAWIPSAGEGYIVGNNGVVSRYLSVTAFTAMTSGTQKNFLKVWGARQGDVLVLADSVKGYVYRGVRGATFSFSPATPTMTAIGSTLQMAVTTRDFLNNVVPGVLYNWTSSNHSTATVSTSGLVTAAANGTTNICITAIGGPVTQTCTLLTVAQSASSMTIDGGDAQSGAVDAELASPPTVLVKDANGHPAVNVEVSLTVLTGGGTTSGTVTSNGSGIATLDWTLGPTATANSIQASAGSASPVTITATGTWKRRFKIGPQYGCASTAASAVMCWGLNTQGEYGAFGAASAVPIDVTVPDVVEIGSGTGSHSCGILSDQSATCWGRTGFGQLGGGTLGGAPLQTVTGGILWSQISTGRLSSCGVSTTGVAYCWGSNQSGEIGSVTIGITTGGASGSPVVVDGGHTWTSVTVGWQHACGIVANGDAYCWGDNRLGSVGAGTAEQQYRSPVLVDGGLKWTKLSAGSNYTCGITTTKRAYCWGLNDAGQLGDGTTTNRISPAAVADGGASFTDIAASTGFGGTTQLGSNTTCALTEAGSPYCWGFNRFGNLGNGGTASSSIPVAVTGGLVLNGLSLGFDSGCGMRGDAIWCWGWNDFGQLGNGTQFNSHEPVTVSGGYAFTSIARPAGDVCGVVTAGVPSNAVCWGTDVTSATLSTFSNAPVAVPGALPFTSVSGGTGSHACGLTTAGDAYCWGNNAAGQLGNGTTSTTPSATPELVTGGLTFSAIAAGSGHTCALTTSGAAYCWGFNSAGQLGDGSINAVATPTPTAVVGGHTFQSIDTYSNHTCAITTLGAAYCWGLATSGQLGNGAQSNTGTPAAVSGGFVFTSISAGASHTCAIRDNQAVYCWGANSLGSNGNNTSGGVQLAPGLLAGGFAATPFTAISAGTNATCGISAGNAYCWGTNSLGQAGQPTTFPIFTTPSAVVGGLTFDRIAVGGTNTCALTAAGNAYCWGTNNTGQLGNGATVLTLPGRVTGF